MKIGIIGDGLVGLTLANVLIQKDLFVDIYALKKNSFKDQSRTLGISKSNINYFNNQIMSINKISWQIKKIKIFTDKDNKKELLEFNNKDNQIFSIIRNHKFQKKLFDKLKKSKLVKFINKSKILKNDYDLIISSDKTHPISKKYFHRKIEKNYYSYAYTTTFTHKKNINNTAYQNFTKNGPIAFLPISNFETSIVYSIKSPYKKSNLEMDNLAEKYNPIYSIKKINNWSSFQLNSSSLRNYYKSNILAFGDLLHKIHPLAGQGFNMSLRDIRLLSDLIDKRMSLGLNLDESICYDFQRKIQSKNYIFSSSIDWIYELFNLESKIKSNLLKQCINVIGNNKVVNMYLKKFADIGIQY